MWKEGAHTTDIIQHLKSKSTVYHWVTLFKEGGQNLEDDSRSGHPSTSSLEKNVWTVEKMVMTDQYMTLHEIAQALDMSISTVYKILYNHLGMNKISARWVS